MQKRTRYYAEFLAPGLMVGESWANEVASGDKSSIQWPEKAYAFRLYSQDEIVCDGVTYRADRKQIGKTFYHPGSKVESLSEVRNNPNASSVLVANMKCNGWSHIVWTRWGTWPQPYEPSTMEVLR